MKTERLTFAYLMYTDSSFGNALIGVYKSLKAAKAHMDLTTGHYITIDRHSKRVLQKGCPKTRQIWYVEKHVMRDGM